MFFCTLFNKNYLARGIVLYHSLQAQLKTDFTLYAFAFDQETYNYLTKAKLPHLIPISLIEFEDEALLNIKQSRTSAEYCWTCTPSTIRYCIQKYNIPHCAYLDADMYFYNNPQILLNELGSDDVLITAHNYSNEYNQSLYAGKYCVQFLLFKNTANALAVLENWRNNCIDWCYSRYEDGRFGDQKYLDSWQKDFEGVRVSAYLGAGLAPWNANQVQKISTNYMMTLQKSTENSPLIFFHFHGLKFFTNAVLLTDFEYEIPPHSKIIYKTYIELLTKQEQLLAANDITNSNGMSNERLNQYLKWLTFLKRLIVKFFKRPSSVFYTSYLRLWNHNNLIKTN